MKKQLLTSSLLLMLAFFTGSSVFAQTQVCGTVYLELYDSYGDGWNGNEIDVKFTGGDSTYTLSSGSFISIPLSVNYLDTAEFVWQNGGSYTSECTYKVTDAAGTVLYSSPTGNNMTIGSTQYTAYCATPPVPQICGTVYLELYDSYGDGWNGNEIDVSFTGGDSTFTMSSGSFVSYALTIPYQDTAHFIWQNGGSYTSECTYKVTDAYGTVLYSSPTGNNMTIGATQYSLQCNSLASCIAPTNLSVTTGTTDAALSFDGTSSYAYHLVEYDTAGFAPGTGDTMWVYADTAYITGLMPATSYDFYVTTLCSASDSSAATASLGQFTQCAALATPWSENFDNTTAGSSFNPSLPQCWDFYNQNYTGSFYYPYVYNRSNSSYANSGSNALYAYRSSSSSTSSWYLDTVMAITPEIQGLDSATKQLKFYGRDGSNFSNYTGMVIIGLTDAAGTPSSLRLIDTVYANTDAMTEYTVYLDGAQTGESRVAFVFLREIGTFDYVYIDDVSITDIPPCPEPIGLSLASASRTSATINWSSSSAAFDIEVGPMGFTQGTGTSYTSTTNSVTATNLMQNTYYDAYVRSNCSSSGDGYSSFVGPFTFKTECGWFSSPYVQDFGYSDGTGSSSNPDLPDCWSHENLSAYIYNYCYVDKYYYYGNQATDSAYIYLSTYYSQYNSQTALGDTNAVILPMMTDLSNNDQQILFNARSSSTSAAYNAKMAIGTVDSTGDLSTLVIMDTVEFTSTTYADYTLDLDNVPTNAASIAIVAFGMANPGYTYGYNRAYIDRVEIRQAPQCPEVYDVVATATSDTSGTMSWGDSSVVDEYLIDWGLAGFTQGTGVYDTIVGTSWSNNMLMPGETYEFYIQSVCSAMGVNSPWYGPVTLEVPCAPTSIPFADGFENKPTSYGNSSNPNLPDCWTYSVNANPGFSYSYGSTSTWSSYSGSGYLYNRQSNVAGDTVVVSLPMIENLDTDGAVLKFWARVSSTFYQGQMAVATSGVTGDYKTAAVAQNMNLTNNTYQQFSVYLDSNVVPAGAQRPAFLFYSISGSYNYIYLDSVEVEALPACVAYNFAESNVTDSSADLSWSFTGNNSFNLEYGPTGFIQGTGTGAQ
ncbi:MAG: choice-of-anchor J domain-containing protein, partial [Schleiferiaceae bacterium]